MQNEIDKIENLLETSTIDEAIESLLYPVLLDIIRWYPSIKNTKGTTSYERKNIYSYFTANIGMLIYPTLIESKWHTINPIPNPYVG